MHKNNITKIIDCKGIIVEDIKINNNEEYVHIYAKVDKPKKCPHCGSKNIWVHDHRIQKVKDTPITGKTSIIHLKKTRYNCKHCGKRFEGKQDLVPKNYTITLRLILNILKEFKEVYSIKSIAKRYKLSWHTITRLANMLPSIRNPLPEVMCIDEFKGDTGGHKYHLSILDGHTHKLIDIVKSRTNKSLNNYFRSITTEEKDQVKYYITDMYKPYKTVKETYFPKAIHIIDKYHFIRQVTWSMENTRKKVQKEKSKELRLYMKRSKSLLTKPAKNLKEHEKSEVALMLELNENIKKAYKLKELFYEYVLTQTNKEDARRCLKDWIRRAEMSGLKEYKECTRCFTNWFEEITNSFDYPYTNGPLEGFHTKIKTLKRNSFGLRNFEIFRKRIFAIS